MSQVLYYDISSTDNVLQENSRLLDISLERSSVHTFRNLCDLLSFVSVTGASELDLNYPTVVVINDQGMTSPTKVASFNPSAKQTPLNKLSYVEVEQLLKEHYKHLVILTYKLSDLSLSRINSDIESYHETLKNRIVRMKTWVGLNNEAVKKCPCLHSMTNCLSTILHSDYELHSQMRRYLELINSEVDFFSLLNLPKEHDFYKHCIGNWGFIAHELTCDELTFCALLIFQHAFSILEPNGECLKLDTNDILSFLFSLRDSYRGGNSFHNFRHAVDVLQATFYFLIRLGALPQFAQFTKEFNIHPKTHFESAKHHTQTIEFNKDTSLLDPIQTLALLVSSIGHDVGHPGLTNLFLIQQKSPVARIYSNQSVLENYHSTIFQDILGVHWPQFLTNEHTAKGPDCPLNTRAMQVESIIATDMANHFEYISKVEEISEVLKSEEKRLKVKHSPKHTGIILSLIIKCADISNVARPLLISTKWGIVLSREFNEIAMLTDNMTKGTDIEDVADRRDGPFFPASVEEALRENPSLAKGQLFFINTFADSLFKEVATVFPELTFSAEIVLENKRFWMTI